MKLQFTALLLFAALAASAQDFFLEDFSNGFDGSTEFGAWTHEDSGLAGPDVWMMADVNSPGGEFSETSEPLLSETADNGWVIFDADLYNTPISDGIEDLTGFLYSPVMDMTDLPTVVVEWQSCFRYCCFGASPLTVEVSNDGGITWHVFPGHGDFVEAANNVSANPLTVQVDVSCAAANQPEVQIRWAYNSDESSGYSHYYWGIDDVRIFENPLVSNLEVLQVFNGNVEALWEYRVTPLEQASTLENGGLLAGTVWQNNGAIDHENVVITIDILDELGTVVHTVSSAPFDAPSYGNQPICPSQISDTLYIETGWIPAEVGSYTLRSTIAADGLTDDEPANDVLEKSIVYTAYEYAHDTPEALDTELRPLESPTTSNFSATGYGNHFTVPNPGSEALGVLVAHGPNSTPGTQFEVILYKTAAFSPFDLNFAEIVAWGSHTISVDAVPATMDDAQYVLYDFEEGFPLNATDLEADELHVYFAAILLDSESESELTVMGNSNTDTDNSSAIYALSASGDFAWFGEQQDEPAVRLMVGDGTFTVGCTDEEACNYDPLAIIDNYGCCTGICGCANAFATNFDPLAECNDGSCTFEVSGLVFNDINSDGVQDEDEYPLAFQEVTIPELGITLITNDEGLFFASVPEGLFDVFVTDTENFPFNTTPNPHTVWTADSSTLTIEFGVSISAPIFEICVDFYPNGLTFLCDDIATHNICFRNMGNVPIYGVVEVEYDALFQGYEEITPIDSVVDNSIFMSFEGLLPGQMFFYDVGLHTPTVDFIGEYVTSFARITGFYEDVQVAYGENELTMEITCAYDPNDKQVFPRGHTDEHLVLNGTELEYLVRFQNTGNAPAQTVLLRDTIDPSLDLSTFRLFANSHSVLTTVNEESREVTFLFDNIMLPDSTCCEEDSHGLVSYKIEPLPELEAGTEINNTAYIYFDNNEPIVTNTTWTTIHACAEALELTPTLTTGCTNNSVQAVTNYENGLGWDEGFSWTLDEVILSESLALLLTPTEPLEGILMFTASNPLCVEQAFYALDYMPEIFNATCTGDLNCDAVISATDVILFLGEYGCEGFVCHYDLSGDGASNGEDLLMIIGAYGSLCE